MRDSQNETGTRRAIDILACWRFHPFHAESRGSTKNLFKNNTKNTMQEIALLENQLDSNDKIPAIRVLLVDLERLTK
jgi:hypothetical protein